MPTWHGHGNGEPVSACCLPFLVAGRLPLPGSRRPRLGSRPGVLKSGGMQASSVRKQLAQWDLATCRRRLAARVCRMAHSLAPMTGVSASRSGAGTSGWVRLASPRGRGGAPWEIRPFVRTVGTCQGGWGGELVFGAGGGCWGAGESAIFPAGSRGVSHACDRQPCRASALGCVAGLGRAGLAGGVCSWGRARGGGGSAADQQCVPEIP
jgi:hypothetical protein